MAHSFTMTVRSDVSVVLADVKKKVIRTGGDFNGDAQAGRFSGKSPFGLIKGGYLVNSPRVTVTITDKPMLVSANAVEAKIREYFN